MGLVDGTKGVVEGTATMVVLIPTQRRNDRCILIQDRSKSLIKKWLYIQQWIISDITTET